MKAAAARMTTVPETDFFSLFMENFFFFGKIQPGSKMWTTGGSAMGRQWAGPKVDAGGNFVFASSGSRFW